MEFYREGVSVFDLELLKNKKKWGNVEGRRGGKGGRVGGEEEGGWEGKWYY